MPPIEYLGRSALVKLSLVRAGILAVHHEDQIAPLKQPADTSFVTDPANRFDQQPISPEPATNVFFDVDQLALQVR